MTNPETGYEKAHRQAEQIFREVFPARGMSVREGQIRLCHTMLDALFGRDVALCDAGVGLGKTYAYLVACILWQLQKPSPMQRPVVISTASITLQNAILEEYIPFLSDALIQNGYIQAPVCAVLRKGKERFVCDVRLLIRQKQITARGKRFRKRATALQEAKQYLDLDRLPNLPRHERRLICVPSWCGRSCIAHSDCRYRQYLKASNGPSVTIQVCNHNYLLADTAHRQNGWTPLLKDYQALVIDEAHKLPETVRQMNTRRICSAELFAYEKMLTAGHCGLSAQKLRAVTREFLTAFVPPETKAERAILVIPRLPFPVPDPLGEALRTQYCDLHSYIQTEIVPEMQIKLRQGFGRAIRTETDSCVVAILDPRAAPYGRYHRAVLDALPEMPIGSSLRKVRKFYRTHKGPEYFLPK